ncbi:MAG TPA: apolipoprotein N-acyltransferase [Ignavibacteria bacterium]|nr:apolipoprotein N-acyltransferase [Ignavibacteria bacterium]HMR41046.1 apolipoprotein N-acyltransferase [Ignavibacteria bacterium]
MFKNSNKKLFLPILTAGIFYSFSFPPIDLYYLICFSFVLLIDVILNSSGIKQTIFRSYSVFFVASLIGVSWIGLSGMRENADSFLIAGGIFVVLVYPLFFVLPSVLFFLLNKNFSSSEKKILPLLSFPFLWTGFEYLQTFGQINFPWLFAGNSQSYNLSKIQYAEYTGMFGVSFWICLMSVLLFILFKNIRSSEVKLNRKNIIAAISILVIFFLPDLFNQLNNNIYPETGKLKLGIVQPNINPWTKWAGKRQDLIPGYIEQIKSIKSEHPDVSLIILPETALPYYFRERIFEERLSQIVNACDSLETPLLIGTPDLVYYEDQSLAPEDAKIMKSSGLKYDTYNSAVLFEPGIEPDDFQKHQKIKLVIGSERMPYQEILSFTKSIISWGVGLSSWQIGNDTNIFTLPGEEKFNTAVCYESVYPEFFADFVNKGAEFSVIITNDGWWGKFFGTYQHNRFAVFRAIENRRWIARCANTGISDFIDPKGNFYLETEINEKASLIHEVGLINKKTFYTENGDVFSRGCLIISLLFLGVSFFYRNKDHE